MPTTYVICRFRIFPSENPTPPNRKTNNKRPTSMFAFNTRKQCSINVLFSLKKLTMRMFRDFSLILAACRKAVDL